MAFLGLFFFYFVVVFFLPSPIIGESTSFRLLPTRVIGAADSGRFGEIAGGQTCAIFFILESNRENWRNVPLITRESFSDQV